MPTVNLSFGFVFSLSDENRKSIQIQTVHMYNIERDANFADKMELFSIAIENAQ